MFSHDKPINKISEDILGRGKFSKELAQAIVKADSSESLVISLNGDWGSGKSSVINMVKDECVNTFKDNVKVVNFNPWYYTDRQNLILKFFEVIAKDESIFENTNKRKKIFEIISKYAANFESIPYVSYGIKPIKNISDTLRKNYENKLTIESQIKDIKEIFTNLKYKLLIIIDDIDRLVANEIRDIFQLVKLVGDIPNIVYLLSFDREVVRLALDDFHKGKGEDYLEKIVQVQFELPQLKNSKLEKYFTIKLEAIINNDDYKVNRWIDINRNGILHFIKTLRHVNRYMNTLNFDYQLVKEEVNVVDFLGITAIKVFRPELYSLIRNNKYMFLRTSSSDRYSSLRTLGDKYKEDFSRLINISNLEHYIKSLLIILFPKTYEAIGDGYYTSILQESNVYRRNQRICDEVCFDIYFDFSLPEEFISNNTMRIYLNEKDEKLFKQKLLELNKENKIFQFLDRLEDFTKEIPIEDIPKYINTLIDIGDVFNQEPETSFFYSSRFRISRITYQLLSRIENRHERFKILKNAFINAEMSLCTIIEEIASNDSEHGRFGREKQKAREENTLIEANDLDELEKIGLNLIEKWNDKDKLLETKELLDILFRWKEWGGAERINNFFKDKSNFPHNAPNLLVKLLNERSSQRSDEYEPTYHKYFDKNIKEVFDVKPIYNIVKSFSERELNGFTKEQKEAIKLFIDYYEGKTIEE
jgi:predicted KAP-like P-loop ATPase